MPWSVNHILSMWRKTTAQTAQYCMIIFVVLWNLSPVFGKDLNVLTRILYAAFAAEQMSAICTSAHIPLSDSDMTRFTSAKVYADGIKQIVIAGLADTDVNFILRSAADQAKAVTRAEIEALSTYPSQQLSAKTLQWCKNKVIPFADQVVGAYVRNPDEIRQLITKAKAD